MKRIIKNFFILGAIFLCLYSVSFAKNDVPDEYRANANIQPYLDNISELFLKIDASNQIGEDIENSIFVQTYNNIQSLIPYLPQDYQFKLVYTNCKTLSKKLSMGRDYDVFSSFMENCHRPFGSILQRIQRDYTVNAVANSYPKSGSAPLVVTFDARTSSDPSNETIPANNYYWFYRGVDGNDKMIGKGSTIKHTFSEAGTYKVHLTVRSSNNTEEGILDGSDTVTVKVKPKAAQINILANNKKLEKNNKIKFGTQEAKRGILFDASSTIPMGGREILSHTWKITGPDTNFVKTLDGNPRYIKIALNENGEYRIILTTVDNENNQISETYGIIITDPVAVISPSVEKGDTSTKINFSATESYSIVSNLKLYTREIFDSKGEKIDTYQGKTIQKQFKKPGNYTIKLTVEDALGRTNISTKQMFIESTPPVAQFSSTPTSRWKNPSEYILDGSLSHDIDKENGFDELVYEWTSSDPQNTIIMNPDASSTKIQFNTVGTHTVYLTVKDKYGKIGEIQKDFNIISTLRPKISFSSRAITWGEYINFVVTSEQDIISYQWDFGDKNQRNIQTNIIKHRYTTVGNYAVKLKVYGKDKMENELYATVFVGDKDKPIPAYNIYTVGRSEMLYPKDTCKEKEQGEIKEYPAYQIDRYQEFYVNAVESVNSRGLKKDLKYFFKIKDENIYVSANKFKYKFKKLGCRYMDLTVEDTKLGKTVTQRIWFKVYNSMPTLDNIELFFPQYGNQMGVGFNQNTVKDIFNSSFDPLQVKVMAINPRDDDGYISYYKRYYYRKDDPNRHLELKITPSTIPYAYFSLPRMPGEFMFGVTLYDNNEGITKSESIIGNGPMVVFPPDTDMPDVPIVTAKVDKTSITLGDEITFDVVSKIISDRKDFDASRVIRYDFEGDGKRDLTTKSDRVTHTYQKDGTYTPIIEVSYRGYYTESSPSEIIVKKGIKPMLMFDTYGSLAIFRTKHVGNIITSDICFNVVDCKQNKNSKARKKDIKDEYFSYTYPDIKKYYVNVIVKDNYANTEDKTREIDLKKKQEKENIHLLSIPKSTHNKNGYDILVGKNLNNSIVYYVSYSGSGECYVDIDITDESTKDFECNTLHFQKFTPNYKTLQGKIFYIEGKKKKTKKLTVGFLDFAVSIDSKMSSAIEKIDSIQKDLDTQKKDDRVLNDLLEQIKKDIINKNKTQSNILALDDYLKNNEEYDISMEDKQDLQDVIIILSMDETLGALESNDYEKAKSEILSISPENIKRELKIDFNQLENIEGEGSEIEYRKTKLQEIGSMLHSKIAKDPELQSDSEITKDDFNFFVHPNICKIAKYYNINTDTCSIEGGQESENITQESNIKTENTGMPKWLRILLIALGIIVGGFLVMIIVFAIKARMNTEEE